ncbi:Altronate hydrolase [Rhodovastum atsumiense]|uniref:Altronate dehydratase n=1 Tax=Rhodovastum atsumiense TaxID=504468 RepID=A0A5M6IIU4_9PROT|nr:altronate dehydratase family protein [Rhodovastum atsumiense]KAA5608144.1 altronate dehydratase [Rhodovastum atsumiense]CAH2599373.1 Altronate hydrolase [Rhodovastum atsumiense]
MLAIRLHPADTVVVALSAIAAGTGIEDGRISARAPIPAGHKIATAPMPQGAPVIKYNQVIGFATTDIAPGDHVHTHNVGMGAFDRDYAFGADAHPTVPTATTATFEGYVRADGQVGTRNYIGIIPSVNCSVTAARQIADHFRGAVMAEWPNVDGVVALAHGTGCGTGATGEMLETLRRTMGGYARHANFHAVLMIGLGCEVNQIAPLLETEGLQEGARLRTMTIQELGGTARTVRQGIEIVREMLAAANEAVRSTVPVSHLRIGLQCGGSDGYSGITANPALGAAVDLLVAQGGTAVLSETPEIYGAEHLLTRRAINREVGEKLVARIRWWEEYTTRTGGEMNNNPSPGNKAGGLTTILEKSLGAVAKAGTSNVVDVLKFAERVGTPGLVFMDTPGYDPVSATGQVAGGCNLICFTTGRGSVFGCKPTPSLKLATNSELFRRMEDDMDLDCGPIARGEVSVAEMGRRILDLAIATASGHRSKSEALGFGADEFQPWVIGAVM